MIGFMLVVGSAAVLLSALAVLVLAWVRDMADNVRRIRQLLEPLALPQPVLFEKELSDEQSAAFATALAEHAATRRRAS